MEQKIGVFDAFRNALESQDAAEIVSHKKGEQGLVRDIRVNRHRRKNLWPPLAIFVLAGRKRSVKHGLAKKRSAHLRAGKPFPIRPGWKRISFFLFSAFS
jgi:hypothetical protein